MRNVPEIPVTVLFGNSADCELFVGRTLPALGFVPVTKVALVSGTVTVAIRSANSKTVVN